ncbi:MAG TPA: glycogen debranching protein GlgX [Vicinamibacterales bacterium]|nr:glycogen debranching protein GlgX [Vicinamibacterales bacterium]
MSGIVDALPGNARVAGADAPGVSAPLGATIVPGGVNFSVFSKNATRLELLLFDAAGATRPARVIPLDPADHRTYHYWHVFVPELAAGQVYGYRAYGPFEPERGLRFDGDKLLLDPYGLAVAVPPTYDRLDAARAGDNAAVAMKSVVADPNRYDWEGDHPLQRPFTETVIYEMHVRGFTRHPSSGVAPATAGTYAGLIEKIPYLADLGVTAVELLPVFQFDPQAAPGGRINYWGYQPVSFFAPHHAYAASKDPLAVLNEFRELVKALHRASIEVILDVVFNHTAEGGADGPTLSYRGLANDVYYILEADKSRYADYTGCGNTLNANQPIVRRMIQDSLRYWVTQMHVDGFRFDLASILSRDETGHPLANPPVLWDIESDPRLAGTKLIAEAWDAAGLYQVGSFVGDSWQEWNGRFRDDVRRFLKSDSSSVRPLAARVLGSPDIYAHKEREAEHSINFVTCHDGFTLNDLVSYDRKHNQDNGENNRDGADENLSWNCGVEGPSDDPAIEALRNRQVKNFLTLVLLAAGTPMLLMGDECRRSQAGNNNAYCCDGEINWLDWRLLARHADVHRFVKILNAYRQRRDIVALGVEQSLTDLLTRAGIEWHGIRLGQPDWSDQSHTIAFTMRTLHARFLFHAICNAYWEPLTFELPRPEDGAHWRRCIDTARESPDDISHWDTAVEITDTSYAVQARSIVLLAQALRPADATSTEGRPRIDRGSPVQGGQSAA